MITEAGLKLAPGTKEKVDPNVPPGTVIAQTPKAGERPRRAPRSRSSRRRRRQADRARGDRQERRRRREDAARRRAHARAGDAPARRPQGADQDQIPAAQEVVKEGKPVDIFMVVPKPAGAAGAAAGAGAGAAAGGDEAKRTPVAAVAGAATAAARAAPSRCPRSRARTATSTRRRSPTSVSRRRSSAVRRRDEGHAVPGRPEAAAPRSRPAGGQAARLGRLPADRLRRRQGRAAQSAARRQEARADRQGHPAGEGPGLELRRRARRLHRATARSSSRTPPSKDGSPIPLTKQGDRFTRPRLGADRQREHARDDQAGSGDTLADAQSSLCFGQIDAARHEPRLQAGARRTCSAARSTGRRTASRSSCSRPSRTASRVRDDALHDREAVLGQAGGLEATRAS